MVDLIKIKIRVNNTAFIVELHQVNSFPHKLPGDPETMQIYFIQFLALMLHFQLISNFIAENIRIAVLFVMDLAAWVYIMLTYSDPLGNHSDQKLREARAYMGFELVVCQKLEIPKNL